MACDPFVNRIRATRATDFAAIDALIDAFYLLPNCRAGGPLHVVLDDSNWHDEHIQSCIDSTRSSAMWDPPERDAAIALGELLLSVPVDDRRRWFCTCGCMHHCDECHLDPEGPLFGKEVCYLRDGRQLCRAHAFPEAGSPRPGPDIRPSE